MDYILETKNLSYYFVDGSKSRILFKDVNYQFKKGTFYTILGPSGCGKTTLLSLLSGLDFPKEGNISFQEKDLLDIGLTNYRKNNVSIVFQANNLIPYLSALDNVCLTMNKSVIDKKKLGIELLKKVGLDEQHAKRNIQKLSGGEQQRVAISRALASDADIIFADEPSGNLDANTEKEIIALFKKICKEEQKTLIVVTHSEKFANASDIILRLTNKNLREEVVAS